jgi:hypothetical protein
MGQGLTELSVKLLAGYMVQMREKETAELDAAEDGVDRGGNGFLVRIAQNCSETSL